MGDVGLNDLALCNISVDLPKQTHKMLVKIQVSQNCKFDSSHGMMYTSTYQNYKTQIKWQIIEGTEKLLTTHCNYNMCSS
jgi:hypothetical protein